MTRQTVLLVVCVCGLAVSSSVVILLLPALFQPGEQVEVWALAVPTGLAVVFAAGGLRWRSSSLSGRRRG